MLGECKNFSACHSCRLGLVNSQRLLLECFSSSVPFFSFGFLRLFFFFFLSSFYLVINFLFCFGGKNRSVRFFFPLPAPLPRSLPPSKRLVFGSVLCFRALWFQFLGLSCCVVVLQTHCDLKASVPVPTTIQEGGRGPTAGMLRQKVTTRAQRTQRGWLRQMAGGQSLGGVCEERSPVCLT